MIAGPPLWEGNDMAHLPGSENTILGTKGADKLKGTKQDDSILAGGGNDRVNGKKGNDYIEGGAGNDTIKAGQGNDWLVAGGGDDKLKGKQGADQFRISGTDGTGDDFISDLKFAQGDKLVFYGFTPGTFDDKDGVLETGIGNDLDITSEFPTNPANYGEGAVIDSLADIVELVEYSNGVTARKGQGNTLILEIDDGTGVQTVYLKHLFNDYASAGGDYVM
jgi:Ca2+-binding RTX toxin-like protein